MENMLDKMRRADEHVNLEIAYTSTGMDDEAIAEFRTALEAGPQEGEVHQFLGPVYGEKARSELERERPKFAGKLFERVWG